VRRRTIAIIIAVVLALAAAGLVVWYVSSLREETKTVEQTQTVLVATANIPERTTGEAIIEKGLVERQQVVISSVTPGALISEAGLQGKVTTIPILKGQQILQSQLGVPEEQSLSFRIKQGMRAITLPVDRYTGVGGAIRKGDRVDVIASFEAGDLEDASLPIGIALSPEETARIEELTGLDLGAGPKETPGQTTTTVPGQTTVTEQAPVFAPISKMVLQQVEVLAIDPLLESDTGGGGGGVFSGGGNQEVPNMPVITLMVTPADAEILVFVQEFGSVWFTLVPAEDTTAVETTGRVLHNVLR